MKKLRKSAYDRKLCGVCGGIGEFFGIDSTVIRVAFALFALLGGSRRIGLYCLCAHYSAGILKYIQIYKRSLVFSGDLFMLRGLWALKKGKLRSTFRFHAYSI